MLIPFTFEDANKFQWINDYTEQIIAIQLMLATYEQRQEASEFWESKQGLENVCLKAMGDIPKLAAKSRAAFDVKRIGSSREETERALTTLRIMVFFPGC